MESTMEADPSKFLSWESEKKPIEQLQQQILDYLGSEDYSANPYIYFNDIAAYGYESLEEFIGDIPSTSMTEEVIEQNVITPDPTVGMRYVVADDPWKRGVLSEPILSGNLATLRMDHENFHQTVLSKAVSLFLSPVRNFLREKVFPQSNTENENLSYFNLSQVLPEKEHLLTYLRAPGDSSIFRDIYQSLPDLTAGIAMDDQADLLTSDDDDEETERGLASPIPPTDGQLQTIEEVPETVNIETQTKTELPLFPKIGPVGTHKGIEGVQNSCYLDSLLFSMFYTTQIFDFLLQPRETDTKYVKKTRRILKSNVVTPLREIYYCDNEAVMALRKHLSERNPDLMESSDQEKVLYLICQEILMETKFIRYVREDDDDRQEDFMHLMSVDSSDPSKIITIQRNIETSLNGGRKLAGVPSPAFILGMPRKSNNDELIHYEAIVPNTEIDIESFMEAANCHDCGEKAEWEIQPLPGNAANCPVLTVCSRCIPTLDGNDDRKIVSRARMMLISIICKRDGHFTAFVRASASNKLGNDNIEETEATWYFFDSLAEESSEVKIAPNLETWLEYVAKTPDLFSTGNIPDLIKRGMTDGHLCIYEPMYYENYILSHA